MPTKNDEGNDGSFLSPSRSMAVIEVMKDSVITINRYGIVDWVNRSTEETFGYSKSEIIGKNVSVLMPSPYTEKHDSYLANYLSTGIPRIIGIGREVVAKKKDGTTFPIHLSVSEVRQDDETFFCGVIRDLTQIKVIEEEKARLIEQMNSAQRMEALGQLAGGIAHDLNNLLTPIIGFVELTTKYVREEPVASSNLELVLQAACRARDIVSQILTFCRMKSPERKDTKIGQIISEAVTILRSSVPSNVDINVTLRAEDDTCTVDPSQIHQVIMNLGINAAQAMQEIGGTLDITLDRLSGTIASRLIPGIADTSCDYIKLSVSDTGCGMSEETKARAFEPFFTTKAKGSGTGLGLSVCHGIVAAHGGQMLIDSTLGSGTTIMTFFPASRTLSSALPIVREPLVSESGNIVVIDDEKSVLAFSKQALEEHGYTVIVFESATKALRYIEQKGPHIDAIITDHTMPDMSGVALARKIRALNVPVPIVLCSGWRDDQTRIEAADAGVDEFVLKPLSLATLVTTLSRVIKKYVATSKTYRQRGAIDIIETSNEGIH